INGVSLGYDPFGIGIAASAPGIDDGHMVTMIHEVGGQFSFISTSGFHDNECLPANWCQGLQQRGQAWRVTLEVKRPSSTRSQIFQEMDIPSELGDIDPDTNGVARRHGLFRIPRGSFWSNPCLANASSAAG